MKYHDAADFLTSLRRRRPKFGTETTTRMLSHLGNPQNDVDFVQIAGSNGKGSTARMLESVLRTTGLDVGLFTSPSLNDFREQIRVNGRNVSKDRITEYVDRIDPCLDRLRADDDEPTHFEVLTALAILHFGIEDVDVAILEVGIGGRYDATSAIDPVASAVTSVSLEHTELLGDTVAEIARDKAQVAPTTAPIVTGADGVALEAIRSETDAITVGSDDADVIAVENGMRSAVESDVSITGPDWTLETNLSLLGQYQATNAGVAATIARQVAAVDLPTIATGLRKAEWPGRFEIVSTDPMTVLDGSHNPGATAKVSELLERYDYDDLHVVFAAMSDKDHNQMASELPSIDGAFVTRPDVNRAEDVAVLADAFDGHADSVHQVASVAEATERALAAADEADCVLVTGSLYAVAEARDRWTRLLIPKHGGRRANSAAFSEDAFPETSATDVDHRTFTTRLRRDQAACVKRSMETVGGKCVRSKAGAPEKLVATMLAGTVTQFREFTDIVATEGMGLEHLARQVEEALDGPKPDAPFDGESTAVMGIVNVTPDSFHDGGEYERADLAIRHAERLVAAGADIVDIGGESTRPGAAPVSVDEEIDRVVPVIESISSLDVPVSVDTRKAAVAEAALDAGADIVNDVSGLADPEMRFVVADHDASIVLMHSVDTPVDPDQTRTYNDVVEDVMGELAERILLAERAGIDRERILVDPGCGFGKSATESFELVARLPEFRALGCPVMVGHSRKSMFEQVGARSEGRLPPTLAVTTMAAERGADVVRVHDVAENAAVLQTVSATNDS